MSGLPVADNTSNTYRLGFLIKSGPHLAKDLARLAKGSVGVGHLDSRSLLGAEDDIRRWGSLCLGLISLGGLGFGFGSFRGHVISYFKNEVFAKLMCEKSQ